MPSEKIRRPYQPRLPLGRAWLWDKLPELTRARVRQLLTQMLQQVVINSAKKGGNHERKDQA